MFFSFYLKSVIILSLFLFHLCFHFISIISFPTRYMLFAEINLIASVYYTGRFLSNCRKLKEIFLIYFNKKRSYKHMS